MSTFALTSLPTELFDKLIPHVLPEGFESLALTCKCIYTLCKPFIKHYNEFRSGFRFFGYGIRDLEPSYDIRTAWDMIRRIATDPITPSYIQEAFFMKDSGYYPMPREMLEDFTDPHCGAAVMKLLASSPHLKQASLDWKEFYAEIEEDLYQKRYSQNAAAFLLTLLPNIKTLTLPAVWKPNHKTEKLLEIIVRESKQLDSIWNKPSLTQLRKLTSFGSYRDEEGSGLDKVIPFLALPHVREFKGRYNAAISNDSMPLASKDPYTHYGKSPLEIVDFHACCIDEIVIADFLKYTPCLKIFKYSHMTRGDVRHRDWDVCKFVMAIQREVGNQLEELSVCVEQLHSSTVSGKASLCEFKRLQKLELPLEIAMCNINDTISRVIKHKERLTDEELDKCEPLIGDLVPASVSLLSLRSKGTDYHEEALKAMFHNFISKKDSQLPALKEIHIACPMHCTALVGSAITADWAYKKQCDKLVPEIKRAGVAIELHHNRFSAW